VLRTQTVGPLLGTPGQWSQPGKLSERSSNNLYYNSQFDQLILSLAESQRNFVHVNVALTLVHILHTRWAANKSRINAYFISICFVMFIFISRVKEFQLFFQVDSWCQCYKTFLRFCYWPSKQRGSMWLGFLARLYNLIWYSWVGLELTNIIIDCKGLPGANAITYLTGAPGRWALQRSNWY
jgi:hypothetical protein